MHLVVALTLGNSIILQQQSVHLQVPQGAITSTLIPSVPAVSSPWNPLSLFTCLERCHASVTPFVALVELHEGLDYRSQLVFCLLILAEYFGSTVHSQGATVTVSLPQRQVFLR